MIINNRIFPFGRYKAINLCGIIFTKGLLSEVDVQHEKIHTRQFLELLIVGFYFWYVIEWGIRLLQYRNARMAYYNISFEREAYTNQRRKNYLEKRKPFASFHYLFHGEMK